MSFRSVFSSNLTPIGVLFLVFGGIEFVFEHIGMKREIKRQREQIAELQARLDALTAQISTEPTDPTP